MFGQLSYPSLVVCFVRVLLGPVVTECFKAPKHALSGRAIAPRQVNSSVRPFFVRCCLVRLTRGWVECSFANSDILLDVGGGAWAKPCPT